MKLNTQLSSPLKLSYHIVSLKSTFSGQYGSVFIRLAVLQNARNVAKFQENLTLEQFEVIQGHRSWWQWKAHR